MVIKTFKVGLKYLLRRPYTRLVPDREGPLTSDRTRGRHVLDMSKCTGCSMCQKVCPADAIQMVKVEGSWPQNVKKIFPRIDYQRCTFCGMCVEACPFNALSMTNISGWYLITRDKKSTLYDPEKLSKVFETKEYRITMVKSLAEVQRLKKEGESNA